MDMEAELEERLTKAARLVAGSQHLVALVGAGLSVESGVPPFRGPGGLWTKVGEPSMMSYQRFMDDPTAWWTQRLIDEQSSQGPRAEFRMAIERAQPNQGHVALVELERLGILKLVITQNVDNLHRVAGSMSVAEIHGNRTRLRCLNCLARYPRSEFATDTLPPHCPRCGGLVKPDAVMFGEPIPPDVLAVCQRETEQCDGMLVIGTSGTVYPAAGFPRAARERGAFLVEVNTAATPLTHLCDVALHGPSGVLLPRLVSKVRERLPPPRPVM
jgi:NAD-dependent deacetylase